MATLSIQPLTRLSTPHKAGGFTLLEVMIAMGIFAVMGVASYRLLSGEMALQQRLEQASESQNIWQRGQYRLMADLRQIISRPVRDEYGYPEAALVGGRDFITFTRSGWDNPLQQTRSELQRVKISLNSDEEGSYLARDFWFMLDRSIDAEPIEQRLLPDIEELEFAYLDGETEEWLEMWPPLDRADDLELLPIAVGFMIDSPSMGKFSRRIKLSNLSIWNPPYRRPPMRTVTQRKKKT